jgi:CHAD domain-containing protein
VEIKKCRALVDLLNYGAPRFKKKIALQPFLLVFKQAGKVRELQLEISLLRQLKLYPFLKLYTTKLERSLRAELRKFFDLAGPWLREKLNHAGHFVLPHLDKVQPHEIDEFLDGQRRFIFGILRARHLEVDQIHLLRKKVKDFYYTEKIFVDRHEQYKKIDAFQELLGEWHDTVIMQSALQKALGSGELAWTEVQRVDGLNRELGEKERRLFMQILERKEEFLRSVRMLPEEV